MSMELNPEFADNPEDRCACVLLIDTSGSMQGPKIDQVNEGLATFLEELNRDRLTSLRVEVAFVSFDNHVNVVQDFVSVSQCTSPVLETGGQTYMGTAIETALDMLEERKSVYRSNGIKYYRPWIFLITDGRPEGESETAIRNAAYRIQEAENNKHVVFFAVGVENANMEILSEVSVRPAAKLKGLNFEEMFVWLSNSLSRVGNSSPEDEQVPLERPGWAFID